MHLEKQYTFMKWLSRLIDHGYSLEESLDHLAFIEPHVTNKIQKMLRKGFSFHEAIRRQRFKPYAYHFLTIGVETNAFGRCLKLLLKRYAFELKKRKQFRELLYYPLVLFLFALIIFEYIRIQLYPLFLQLPFQTRLTPLQTVLSFHLLKIVFLLFVSGYVVFHLFPRLFNVFPLVRELRTLFFCHQLNLLLQLGYSMEESFNVLERQSHLQTDLQLLKALIIQNQPIHNPFSFLTSSFIHIVLLGIRTNRLSKQLSDYESLAQERCEVKLKRIGEWLQYGLFMLIALNILMVYYMMIAPIMNIFHQI